MDDILVEGTDLADLEAKLRVVLQRCKQHGFVLSRKKFEVGREVDFAGFVISAKGVAPSPRRLEAIAKFPVPKDISGLRGFLGLCNQLSVFVPSIASLASGLRGLLKKDVQFLWLPEHTVAFERMKAALVKKMSIHHFDRKLSTKLITDASKLFGLGYVLIQTSDASSNTPVRVLQCGSRSLAPAERNYSVIELECLAIQWSLRKCDFYLRGLENFGVITDHRPLVGVFSKPLSAVENPRLVRILEKTAPYSFGVKWMAGKHNLVADALSRNPVSDPEDEKGIPARSCLIGGSALIAEIKCAAASCPVYTAIVRAFEAGQHPSILPSTHPARCLLGVWNQLSSVDGGLICVDSSRLFVPAAARKSVLRKLHEAHPGITRMYRTARDLYYWPGLKNDVASIVATCDACQTRLACLPVDNLVASKASAPMERVSTDLFHYGNCDYLLFVDRFSNFPLTAKLSSLSSKTIIDKLKSWFFLFGFPRAIRTDGGPQFRSEFRKFCSDFGIVHEASSPYNPRSNGSAEAGVKAVKAVMAKCKPCQWEESLSLMRNTCGTSGKSPASLFFGRNLVTSVPTITQPLKSMDTCPEIDKLRPLAVGARVRIQDRHTLLWSSIGDIISVNPLGRTYVVRLKDGSKTVRNRRFLRQFYG